MVTAEDRDEAVKFCQKNELCDPSHVIAPSSDKTVLYDTFYDTLERNMVTFLRDINAKASERHIHEIESLLGKLRSRKKTVKTMLTKQCLEKIKDASKQGIVGYRLCADELYVFEDDLMLKESKRKTQIENSILESFKGKVHFKPLGDVLKPQCTIKCGGSIVNDDTKRMGTIGIFGVLQNSLQNHAKKTVAISSPNLFREGDIASVENEERIGVCIWPAQQDQRLQNIHDVSIIEIDPEKIDSIKLTYFDENILIKKDSEAKLDNRVVFKYGAKTQTTYGWIRRINDFQLFERDVWVIKPKPPGSSFSDEGDSGAIVLTRFEGKLYGVGMIYGSHLDVRDEENSENETVATILMNALDRFKQERNMIIQFDKI